MCNKNLDNVKKYKKSGIIIISEASARLKQRWDNPSSVHEAWCVAREASFFYALLKKGAC